jgi:hypothetical protein
MYSIVGSLAALTLAAWSIYEGISLSIYNNSGPAPGLMPFLYGMALVVAASIALCIDLTGVLAHEAAGPDSPTAEAVEPGGPGRVAGYLFLGFLWALAVPWTGFSGASFLGLLLLFALVEEISWPRALLAAGLTTLGAYVVFERLLGVQFP